MQVATAEALIALPHIYKPNEVTNDHYEFYP